MPMKIEKDGKEITVYTQEEVDAEVKGLKVTNENLKQEKQEAEDKAREARESVREAEEAKAKAEGDNETLRRIADEREADKRQAVEDERKRYSELLNMTKREKIDNFITGLLDDVKTADDVKRKHLRKLIKSDYDFDFDLETGEYKVTGDGVTSVDDLKKVIQEGEEYKFYLAGSQASGGGASGSRGSGVPSGKKWSEMTEAEHVSLYKQDPAEYRRLKEAEGG